MEVAGKRAGARGVGFLLQPCHSHDRAQEADPRVRTSFSGQNVGEGESPGAFPTSLG